MPQAADLVLNNGAGTPVAKTFSLINPSAGLNSLALWQLKEGTIRTVFPTITALAKRNGGANSPANRLTFTLAIPSSYTDTVTGLTQVGSAFKCYIDAVVPDDFPEALKNDAVAFSKNLIATALVQAMLRDATPAT